MTIEPGAIEEETIEDSESHILHPLDSSPISSVIRPTNAVVAISKGYLLEAAFRDDNTSSSLNSESEIEGDVAVWSDFESFEADFEGFLFFEGILRESALQWMFELEKTFGCL